MPAYDYSIVADIYDDFCVFEEDIPFFRTQAASAGGRVLELMAGTGRVAVPMVEAGAAVTCVDLFTPMLRMLARKLDGRGLTARLVCADVCSMPFESGFEMVVLPFQGFCELIGEEHQRRCLAEVARVLVPGGRFICTSHNPRIREKTIDGEWHDFGSFSNDAGRTLALRLRTDYSPDRPNVIEGVQEIQIRDRDGRAIETRAVALEFSLVAPQKTLDMAASLGLRPSNLYGDYSGGGFDEDTSPSFIAVLEKRD
jgi:SAM-dependent methyltransferase